MVDVKGRFSWRGRGHGTAAGVGHVLPAKGKEERSQGESSSELVSCSILPCIYLRNNIFFVTNNNIFFGVIMKKIL